MTPEDRTLLDMLVRTYPELHVAQNAASHRQRQDARLDDLTDRLITVEEALAIALTALTMPEGVQRS